VGVVLHREDQIIDTEEVRKYLTGAGNESTMGE
jgi:hypothetical protein